MLPSSKFGVGTYDRSHHRSKFSGVNKEFPEEFSGVNENSMSTESFSFQLNKFLTVKLHNSRAASPKCCFEQILNKKDLGLATTKKPVKMAC